MTPSNACAFVLIFVGGSSLAGCTNGRLDVLEPRPREGDAGAGPSGGSGGSGTSGGSSGSGGSAGGAGASGPSPFVLDDFEDNDTQSHIPEGFWYYTPDPSSTCMQSFGVEPVTGRTDNSHAIRTRGGGCTAWGALLGLDLGGTGETFDSTSYDELRLWARAEPGTFAAINVSLLDPYHFDTVIDLTSTWQEFRLPLNDFFFNDDEGDDGRFDRQGLTHLQFFVFSAEPFDFWLDDLAFVRNE